MNVLFLDTESNNSVVRQYLGTREVPWNYHFVRDEQQATIFLNNNSVDVLVLDVIPRAVERLEFLLYISERFPRTIRIVYTETINQDTGLRALNSSHRYLAKTEATDELISCISRTLILQQSVRSESMRWLVNGLTTLPSIPETYNQLIKELNSENSTIDSITEIVYQDPAITSKILQIVNSALFGMRHPIKELKQAIPLLGTNTIKSLTLSIGAFQKFSGNGKNDHAFVGLMQHSLEVAIFSQTIVKEETGDEELAAEAFTAGILHDIGKLILFAAEFEKYEQAIAMAKEQKIELIEAERQIWGANHAEMGALLLANWGLPNSIIEVVALHHQPQLSQESKFTSLTAVAAADAISRNSHVVPIPHSLTPYLSDVGCSDKLESWTDWCLDLVSA